MEKTKIIEFGRFAKENERPLTFWDSHFTVEQMERENSSVAGGKRADNTVEVKKLANISHNRTADKGESVLQIGTNIKWKSRMR